MSESDILARYSPSRPALPWADLPPDENTLPFQGLLAPDPRTDGCVFSLRYGRGFVRYEGSKRADRRD